MNLAGWLGDTQPGDGVREAHDDRALGPVLLVLGVLGLHAWILSGAAGIEVSRSPSVPSGEDWVGGGHLGLYFLVVGETFLLAYFLPLSYKPGGIAAGSVMGLVLILGPRQAGILVAGHAVVHLVFFPPGQGWPQAAGRWLRFLVVQTPLVVGLLLCLASPGPGWGLAPGLLLLFWQWERLMVFHADHADGKVPEKMDFRVHICLFLNPAVLPNWHWMPFIGQGYAYPMARYLHRPKSDIVRSGAGYLALSLGYLLLGPPMLERLHPGIEGLLGTDLPAGLSALVRAHALGEINSTAVVLACSFLDLLHMFVTLAALAHFQVGVWRILGFDLDPHFDRPWLATNLGDLWKRFAFHYRAFLMRVFYLPVLLHVRLRWATGRIALAVMAAATVGNLVWGHVPARLLSEGPSPAQVIRSLSAWPYFVLLGVGILASQAVGRRRSPRRPWTLDRHLPGDVLAAILTLGFFALIHVFARPVTGSTLGSRTRLFLLGLGFDTHGITP